MPQQSEQPPAQIIAFSPERARPGLLSQLVHMRVEMALILRNHPVHNGDERLSPQRIASLLETAHAAFFKDLASSASIAADASVLAIYAINEGTWGSLRLLPILMRLQETAVRISEAEAQPAKHAVIGTG